MTGIKKGVIEGFYGIPWTFEQRYSMISFLSDINMNQYIYMHLKMTLTIM